VNVRAVPSSTVAVAGTPVRVGAAFELRTFNVIGRSVLVTPSLTRTAKLYASPPWSLAGVHEKTPVDGLILAPAGPPTREKVSVWAGRSAAEASASNASVVISVHVAADASPLRTAPSVHPF